MLSSREHVGYRSSSLVALGLAVASASCGSSTESGVQADAASQPAPDASATKPDAGSESAVRFIAMGDTGTGSSDQFAVGAAVAEVCATRGCDFVLLLGDNFYDAGVSGVDDPLWQDYFELPYAGISNDVPFYAVMGNHDYGGALGPIETGGLGNEFDKAASEIAYTQSSDKWKMPATFYTVRVGNVGLIMLDTNSIMWGDLSNGDQESWYATALQEVAGADWIFGVGHHPYLSNGAHGNAGSYESLEVAGVYIPNPVSLLNGDAIKSFFDTYVCGTINVYFSGHDHNREWIDEPEALCGAQMIVSGAGAKSKDLGADTNTSRYQDGSEVGFAYVVVDGPEMTLQFLDADLNVDYEDTLSLP